MPRSRATLTAPIVLAIVLLGVFAIRSRGAEGPELTNQRQNCAPVARADVVVAAPGAAVDVDVLANDTDADGDALVFQLLESHGGSAVVDDGGTPLDGSDDRVRFTPEPSVPQASFAYRAVDPDGASGASLVTVFVNDQRLAPAGVASEELDTNPGACGTTAVTATTFPPLDPRAAVDGSEPTYPTRRVGPARTTPTTTSTATTRRGETTTTAPKPNAPPPSRPPSSQPLPTNPPSSDPDCGPPPTSGSEAEEEAYKRCLRDNR